MSDDKTISVFMCGPPKCEHVWDGPGLETETSSSATCSKCGVDAMTVSLWAEWPEVAESEGDVPPEGTQK